LALQARVERDFFRTGGGIAAVNAESKTVVETRHANAKGLVTDAIKGFGGKDGVARKSEGHEGLDEGKHLSHGLL
jgi:hypothetical protein